MSSVEREFDAPIERVWAAWTTPDDLRAGGARPASRCPRAEVDIRAGRAHLRDDAGAGRVGRPEYHNTWDIIEIEPPRRLRYVHQIRGCRGHADHAAEAGIPAEGVPARGRARGGAHRSRRQTDAVEMVERGYATEEARDMSRGGLEQCLDKMAAHVASRAEPMRCRRRREGVPLVRTSGYPRVMTSPAICRARRRPQAAKSRPAPQRSPRWRRRRTACASSSRCSSTGAANVTTSFLWFALTFWVYIETQSVLATGIIGGAYMLLVAIFAMLFGTLVDRHRKHRVMVLSAS